MTFADYVAIALIVVCVLAPFIAMWAYLTAPEGYEAKDGFHYGREP